MKPTNELRLYRYVTHRIWTTKLQDVYTETLQQKWIDPDTGTEEWRPLDIVTEHNPNMVMYG